MRTGRSPHIPDKKILLVAAGIIIITVVIIVFIYKSKTHERNVEKVDQGIAYLKSLESQDVSAINESIKAIRVRDTLELADMDERMVWSNFEDTAVLGDSRAVGFSFYELMPEDWVMAESGGIITDVSQHLEKLKRLGPEKIFLCYGINDINCGLWPDPLEYAAECAAQMQALTDALPDSKIYLNLIMPVAGVASWDVSYTRIEEYNEALRAMAEEKGYRYIDNTAVAEEHQDLFQEDGIHLQKEFYKYWVANMLTEVDEQ